MSLIETTELGKHSPKRMRHEKDANDMSEDNESVSCSSSTPSGTRKFLGIEVDRFNIARPWSPGIYFDSLRGVEDFQIFFWIAKDLGWMQHWMVWAVTFGGLTMLSMAVMIVMALRLGNIEEIYFVIASALWLCANFLWMFGEVTHDDDDVFGPKAAHIFTAAMSWLAVYYLILQPSGLVQPVACVAEEYEAIGLKPRFSIFKNWRQYENFHTLLWLGKDFAWNLDSKYVWLVFSIPTVVVGLDFIWITFHTKDLMIDCVHHTSTLIWVLANAVWAIGELFFQYSRDDKAYPFWEFNSHTITLFRWWGSWLLIIAYVPVIALYLVWIPLTCYGYLDEKEKRNEKRRGSLSRLSRNLSGDGSAATGLRMSSFDLNSVFGTVISPLAQDKFEQKKGAGELNPGPQGKDAEAGTPATISVDTTDSS